MAHRMGIRSPLQPVCSITLGTQAVNPLEMTDAYATLADAGHPPRRRRRSRACAAASGDIAREARAAPASARCPQTTADQVTYALQARRRRTAPAPPPRFGRPIAGKTGTAENSVDAWFCGYTPQLATCVWVGYPHKEVPMSYVEGYAGGLRRQPSRPRSGTRSCPSRPRTCPSSTSRSRPSPGTRSAAVLLDAVDALLHAELHAAVHDAAAAEGRGAAASAGDPDRPERRLTAAPGERVSGA